MFQSQPNCRISSHSKGFVPAGTKCAVFREGCDKNRHKLHKIFSCARASHSSQKCDKGDAFNYLSPKKSDKCDVNHTNLRQMGSWAEIRVRTTLSIYLSIYLCIYVSMHLCINLSIYLSIYLLSICLSYLHTCIPAYLHTCEPTPWLVCVPLDRPTLVVAVRLLIHDLPLFPSHCHSVQLLTVFSESLSYSKASHGVSESLPLSLVLYLDI